MAELILCRCKKGFWLWSMRWQLTFAAMVIKLKVSSTSAQTEHMKKREIHLSTHSLSQVPSKGYIHAIIGIGCLNSKYDQTTG